MEALHALMTEREQKKKRGKISRTFCTFTTKTSRSLLFVYFSSRSSEWIHSYGKKKNELSLAVLPVSLFFSAPRVCIGACQGPFCYLPLASLLGIKTPRSKST
jgi:hypothetical protein